MADQNKPPQVNLNQVHPEPKKKKKGFFNKMEDGMKKAASGMENMAKKIE